MRLIDLLERAALQKLDKGDDGLRESGHNGPYLDPETPIRN